MKIAILAPIAWRTPPKQYGPWEQVASNITEGLVANGIDVTLFATGDSITSADLRHCVDTGYAENSSADAKVNECLHISQVMEQSDEFDLIHNHFDFLPLTYSKLINTPILTTIHGFSSQKIVPVYQKYNGTTHYVSISNADRNPHLTYTSTVYNGINANEFSFQEHSDDYLLFFGRIHPEKGAWDAIQVAKKTGRKLIIAGLIQDNEYYEQKILPYINNQDIVYAGNCGPAERNDLLGKAFCLLHLIHFNEPFGLSVAEAMCCGTPVIAFNRGSMPELIEHNKTGFLVNTIDEAVDAINNITTISRHACNKRVVSLFSKEKMTTDYIKVYQKILGL